MPPSRPVAACWGLHIYIYLTETTQVSEHDNLLAHMQHHNVKAWLLRGCDAEDANTIRRAVQRMPEHRLIRRLARILTQDEQDTR